LKEINYQRKLSVAVWFAKNRLDGANLVQIKLSAQSLDSAKE